MPWALNVPLLPDESLSSWLVRTALRQGCDPLALTGAIWPKWRIWTRDIDREIPDVRMSPLVNASGIPSSEFQKSALRYDCERIAGYFLPETRTWPWLLALGTRNRTHHGGQQFCPLCFMEDSAPYLRRHWRLAWHTGCSVHGVQLVDDCPACKAPIEPHRLIAEDVHLAQCSRCKYDFRKTICTALSLEELAFQKMADSILKKDIATVGENSVAVAEWFSIAAFFLGVVRRASRRPESAFADALGSLGIPITASMMPLSGLSFELLPASERRELLVAVKRLLSIDLEETVETFINADVKATALHDQRKPPPIALLPMIALLSDSPSVTHCHRTPPSHHPKTERAVRASWERLKRRMKAEPPS